MILPIVIHPNPILRTKTNDIESHNITRAETQNLIRNMIETMRSAQGIGLAGPQIDKLLRITVIDIGDDSRVFINPYIVGRGIKKNSFEEGCLSIPGIYGWVKRPEKVTVRYYNQEGKKKREKFDGLLARVIQHEIDHLNGVLFIDKVDQLTKTEQVVPNYPYK